jgi:uncharacterized membrane protein YdjX (TVP38/TMEM64 family)
MEVVNNEIKPHRSKAVVKAVIFLAFILTVIILYIFTPIKDHITEETIGQFINSIGIWAPVVFFAIYAVGVCFLIPGTLLTGAGALAFGPYWGTVYNWIGAMLGACAAFWIGRTLGREYAASLIGDRLKKYDDAIERNGFAAVLYLRLVYFPFTPMNFGMGLTKVRFWDYFFGTGLGIMVGTFIFTFFIGTLKEVFATDNYGELFSFRVFFSVALFIFSFFIPKIIKKIKGEESESE